MSVSNWGMAVTTPTNLTLLSHMVNLSLLETPSHKRQNGSLQDYVNANFNLTEFFSNESNITETIHYSSTELNSEPNLSSDLFERTPGNKTLSNSNSTYVYDNRPHWHKILDKVVTYLMVFNVAGVMFGMGCAIYLKEIIRNLWPPIGIIVGMIGQFIVLPATGFGFSVLLKLKPYEAFGCLVVSCSPGGTFSNFFTFWMEGDLALSIMMTACSSVLAFVGMPFNLWLYSSYYIEQESVNIKVPYLNIIISLGFICVPVIFGMIIRHFSSKAASIITKVVSILGYLSFTTALTSWLIIYWHIFAGASSQIYISAAFLPVTGFTIAYIVTFMFRKSHKVCRTIGIETGSQNIPVALSVILLSFSEPEVRAKMLIFPTLYCVFMSSEALIGIGLYRFIMMRGCTKKEYAQNPGTQ